MAQVQVFEIHTSRPGSNLTPNWFVRVHEGVTPEWVDQFAKPFTGTIPPGRPVLDVNVPAEMREREAAEKLFSAQADRVLEEPELIAYLTRATGCRWSQEDFDRRSTIGFPAPKILGSGPVGAPDGRIGWSTKSVDRWILEKREMLTRLSRLVGPRKQYDRPFSRTSLSVLTAAAPRRAGRDSIVAAI